MLGHRGKPRLSGTGTAQESLPSRVFPPALSQHSQQRLALSLVSVALILRVVSVCASLVAGEWLTPAVCPQGIFFLRHLFSMLLLLFSPSVSPALRDPVDCSPPSSLSFTVSAGVPSAQNSFFSGVSFTSVQSLSRV